MILIKFLNIYPATSGLNKNFLLMNSWFKTSAVLMFAIIFSSISYSQEGFGIKAGLNLANETVEGTSFDIKTGVNAGVMMQFPLGDRFFLNPELLYSVKGYKNSSKLNL